MDSQSLLNPIKVYALGGLGEVGKNTYCIESSNNLLIIDAGVRFPEEDMVGVDYVIPNYSHLKDNQDKIRALLITHGHEDHIGAVPFIVKSVKIPIIYAPRLASALIKSKLDEWKIKENVKIVEYDENTKLTISEFKVSFFRVTHSIPDSFGICIDTTEGRIVHTGDFKMDLTPVGPDIELHKIAKIGAEGVDLLLSESTNAERPGWTPSEKNVLNSINDIFSKAKGRLIVSTFSSNISRIQQIVDVMIKHNRKAVIVGRSMIHTVETAREFGYIKIPDNSIKQVEDLSSLKENETVILCTGSQGEQMSALSRIANGTFKGINIIPGDTIIFSSSAIPGNGASIQRVINQITKLGGEVITNSIFTEIHSSGHASRTELALAIKLFNPTYFMPIHGEYHMLKLHAALANQLSVPNENCFVLNNGDYIIFQNKKVKEGSRVVAEDVYIDGNDITGVSTAVIRDRKILQDDGMVAVFISLNSKENTLIADPKVITLGFVSYGDYENHLTRHASAQLKVALEELLSNQRVTFNDIKNTVRSSVSNYFFRKTQRNPMIIPLILNKLQ